MNAVLLCWELAVACGQVRDLFVKNVKLGMKEDKAWKGMPNFKKHEEARRRWKHSPHRTRGARRDYNAAFVLFCWALVRGCLFISLRWFANQRPQGY